MQKKNKFGKIVFVDQYAFIGGGQTVLLNSIEVAYDIFEKIVVIAPGGGALEKIIGQKFFGAIEFHSSREIELTHGSKSLRDYLRLIKGTFSNLWSHICEHRDADAIYVNGPRLFPAAMLFSVLCRIPAYYHIHINHNRAEKLLINLAAKIPFTRKIIFNSKYVLDQVIGGDISKNSIGKFLLVNNSLDSKYSSLFLKDRFSRKDHGLVVAVVGTIRPEKGQDIAVRLAARIPSLSVHLIGRIGQDAEDWAERLIAQKPNNVHVHGDIIDVPNFIDEIGAQIYLVPSQWAEPFGLVAIEGMALSCIAIVSNRGGLMEIAKATGALAFDSEEQLFEITEDLSEKPAAELRSIAANQYENTLETYHMSNYFEEMTVAILNSLPVKRTESVL